MVSVEDINLRRLVIMNGMDQVLRSVHSVRYSLSGMDCYALVVRFDYRLDQ